MQGRRHKHLPVLAGAGHSCARWHVALWHAAVLDWVSILRGSGIRHHRVPGLEGVGRLQVGMLEIMCHETSHVVHRLVYLEKSHESMR